MIQGKSHHAESRAKTRKSSAAQIRIQGKTTTTNNHPRVLRRLAVNDGDDTLSPSRSSHAIGTSLKLGASHERSHRSRAPLA